MSNIVLDTGLSPKNCDGGMLLPDWKRREREKLWCCPGNNSEDQWRRGEGEMEGAGEERKAF